MMLLPSNIPLQQSTQNSSLMVRSLLGLIPPMLATLKPSLSINVQLHLILPANTIFDHVVAHLCVQSEHCMGALKGRFQCLCGLQVNIGSNLEHAKALCWVTVAIILHNLILDVEGNTFGAHFIADHGHEK